MKTREEVFEKLAEPISPQHIKWKIQSANANQADEHRYGTGLVVCYIDARRVMKRLDTVLGKGLWRTVRTQLRSDKEVAIQTEIQICINNEWYTGFTDAGTGTDVKGAYSDSLKRAAVHLGIGRNLYDIDQTWVDLYTKQKKPSDKNIYSMHKNNYKKTMLYFESPTAIDALIYGENNALEGAKKFTSIFNTVSKEHQGAFINEINEMMTNEDCSNFRYYLFSNHDKIMKMLTNEEFRFFG